MSTASWSLDSLIFARLVLGVGGGIVQPASIAILSRAFPPHVRGRAFGIWTIGMMIAPSLGPTAGGIMIEMFNWRSIFSMSLVVGVLAVIVAVLVLDRSRTEESVPFDWKGYGALATFLVAGFLSVTYGQEEGWGSGIILLGLATTAVSLVLFIVVEWDAEHPILPLRLFRIPDFSLATAFMPVVTTGVITSAMPSPRKI